MGIKLGQSIPQPGSQFKPAYSAFVLFVEGEAWQLPVELIPFALAEARERYGSDVNLQLKQLW